MQFAGPSEFTVALPARGEVSGVRDRTARTASSAPPGLSVRRLGKSIGGRRIIDDVSFRVARGETVGLLGPNGAGKTTLFSIVCGLTAADEGCVLLDGTDITRMPAYRRGRLGINYLLQQSSIFAGLTVEQNIEAVIEHRFRRRNERRDMVHMVLEEFDLMRLRRTSAVHLSGGERRRVEIARILACAPQFILFDEPFASVDPIAVDDVAVLIRRCAAWGIGILITDHNLHATLGLIDRAIVVHDGKVLAEGSPTQIVNDADVRSIYLGAEFNL